MGHWTGLQANDNNYNNISINFIILFFEYFYIRILVINVMKIMIYVQTLSINHDGYKGNHYITQHEAPIERKNKYKIHITKQSLKH